MSKTIRHFRDSLSAKTPEDTLVELQGWLSAGDRNIMRNLVSLKRNQGVTRLRGDLSQLINQIEEESPKLAQFLFHYHSANEAFEDKRWEEAELHLSAAIDLHQPEYLALKKDLERKLALIHDQTSLETLVEQGNAAYVAKDWELAKATFQKAKRLYYPSCPWEIEEFDDVISNCNKALAVQKHISQAKVAQRLYQWKQAIQEFQLALGHHFPDYELRQDEIEEEINWCQSQLKASIHDQKLDKPAIITMRKLLLPMLFALIIGALAWIYLKYPTWSDQEPAVTATLAQGGFPEQEEVILTEEDAPFFPEDEFVALPEDVVESPAPEYAPSAFSAPAPSFEPTTPTNIQTVPAAALQVRGNMAAGEPLTFRIANFDPSTSYQIDFGDGRLRPMTQTMSFSFPEAGVYNIKILSRGSAGGGTSVLKRITIAPAPIASKPVIDSAPAAPVAVKEPEVITAPVAQSVTAPASVPVVSPKPEPVAATPAAPTVNKPLDLAEVMPQFPGGAASLKSYLKRETRYPSQARENEIEGKVYVQFVVNTDGSLSNVRLARGIGFGCDEEALRLVNNMPSWRPGSQDGVTVPVRYTLPITFVLQ